MTQLSMLAVDNGLGEWTSLANMTAVGALILVVIWMITRGFPRLLERSDEAHSEARREFITALDRQTDSRSAAAQSGHDVAAKMQVDLHEMAAEMRRANDMRLTDQRFANTSRASPAM